MSRIRYEIVHQRIKFFEKRFGKAHLYLAHHAAFPLALTPDLLYRLWANFQLDINGEILNIPWIAVADLLLSSLCHEVGHELYEMDLCVRNELLKQLKSDKKFGQKRINDLSGFLLAYMKQQPQSDDPDTQDFAHTLRWAALAYTRPSKLARELALAFSQLKENETLNLMRIASLTNTFAEPLAEFQPLLIYADAIKQFNHGNFESAKVQMDSLFPVENKIFFQGINLPIPIQIQSNFRQKRKQLQVNSRQNSKIRFSLNVFLNNWVTIGLGITLIILSITNFVAFSPSTFGGQQAPFVQLCKYINSVGLAILCILWCFKDFDTSRGFLKNLQTIGIVITLLILSVTSFVISSTDTFGGEQEPLVQLCRHITPAGLVILGVYCYSANFSKWRVSVNHWKINIIGITLLILSVTSFVISSPSAFGGEQAPLVQLSRYITSVGLAALGINFFSKREI
jgi:hypothetical protein